MPCTEPDLGYRNAILPLADGAQPDRLGNSPPFCVACWSRFDLKHGICCEFDSGFGSAGVDWLMTIFRFLFRRCGGTGLLCEVLSAQLKISDI
jgi:hypothetical protein